MTPSPTQVLKGVLQSVLSGKGHIAALFSKPFPRHYRIVIEVRPEESKAELHLNIEALR